LIQHKHHRPTPKPKAGLVSFQQQSNAARPVAPETERAEQKKLAEQKEAQAAEAKQAEQEKLRKQQAIQKRFEEIREICGWQEVQQPPGGGGTGE
jgi:hypothetical protein